MYVTEGLGVVSGLEFNQHGTCRDGGRLCVNAAFPLCWLTAFSPKEVQFVLLLTISK